MKCIVLLALILLIACSTSAQATGPATAPTTAPADWKLTWSDEFDGTQIDRSKWDFDTGTGFYKPASDGKPGVWIAGWGNNELENYTDRAKNAFVEDGMLHIRAIKENYKGGQYTSAKLRTGGAGKTPLFTQKYGRFEIRAKLPTGQGLWPALWLLPQDETYGGWAASGEIDLLEARGSHPDIVQTTLHYGQGWPKNVWYGQQFRLPKQGTIADFHVYALEWEPGEIRVSVDDQVYFKRNFWFSQSGNKNSENPWPAPFDQPFYLIMNLAVGGQFGGNPDKTTSFPQEMVVDYVRVYEKTDGPGVLKPRGAGDVHAKSTVKKPPA